MNELWDNGEKATTRNIANCEDSRFFKGFVSLQAYRILIGESHATNN